jgi:AAA15 family ATPase/GTPase
MITNVLIENFKGIKSCDINDLSNINLLIGKNDSCKSTIMEVIYTTLKEFIQPSLRFAISRRSNVSFGGREIWYDYDTNNKVLSQIKFGNGLVSMTIDYDKNNNLIMSNLKVEFRTKEGGSMRSGPSSYYYGTDWSLRESHHALAYLEAFPVPERVLFQSWVSNSVFIDSSFKNNLQHIETLLGQIKLQGKDKEFGKLIFDIFGKGDSWEFIPHPDFPGQFRAAIKERERLVFLNALGDGIRFAMLIVACSMLANNTAIFIEEVENNQHPESLKKIVPLLVNLSRENKLQLFITTHNPFVWRLFEKEFEKTKDREDSFRCFHVVRNYETGVVNCIRQTKENADEFFSNVDKDLYGP